MRPCCHPGCPRLVARGYCDEHRRIKDARDRQRRGSATERGYDAAWRAVREQILAAHPTCARCGAPATLVDHVIPLRRGGHRLDPHNLQTMCRRCHAAKTLLERP